MSLSFRCSCRFLSTHVSSITPVARLWSLLAAFAVSASLPVIAEDAVAPESRLVGIAKRDITPDHPIRLSGFGFRREESEGVLIPIYARAIAIGSDFESPAILLTIDSTGVSRNLVNQLAARLKPRGISPERLAVTTTHTHTAPMIDDVLPTLFGEPIPPAHREHIQQYTVKLLDDLEQVCLAALADRQPATLSWGRGEATFAKNRRAVDGPRDHGLPVLLIRSSEGAVRGVLATYACHAVTLSHNLIGGDWPGFACDALERAIPGCIAMVSIGCGADQNPLSGVTGDKVDVARMQGLELADEVLRLLKGYLAPVRGPVTASSESFALPLAPVPSREHWVERQKTGSYIGYHATVQLEQLDRGEALPTEVDYSVQRWSFGDDLHMVFLPGEVVVDYALHLRRKIDPDRLWVHAYANDTPCYIPSERVLKEGGYEGASAMTYYNWPAPFAAGLEETIVAAVLRQTPASLQRSPAAKDNTNDGLSPRQSMRRIEFSTPVDLQLVAAEPLIADPVAIDFAADGSLWVCEMNDYPSGLKGNFEAGGRVRHLIDDNGDGIYDRSTIFLRDLPFPTGVTAHGKGVLICAAPDILYAEDTDGDGVADRREVVVTGFGTENYQARVNSLTWGMDGWYYGSCGLFGGDIHSPKRNETIALGHRDFRLKPDEGLLEPMPGRTQQGLALTDAGDRLGCHNGNAILHYPFQDVSTRPGLSLPPTTRSIASGDDPYQIFPIRSDFQLFKLSGPAGRLTAACGLGIYRDDWLGAAFGGNSFTCEPVNLLVHRRQLSPSGLSFAAHRASEEASSEFLRSTDNYFRPVQARTGPDGCLWIVDMSRGVIEHPRWIPEEVRETLDIRAGDRRGRIYRVRPTNGETRQVPKLETATDAELIAALNSPNGIVRDLAQQQILRRDIDVLAPLLLDYARNPDGHPAGRSAAFWSLAIANRLEESSLQAAITSPSSFLRQQAARILARSAEIPPFAESLLLTLRNETDDRVLAEVIAAAHRLDQPAIAELVRHWYRAHGENADLAFLILRGIREPNWNDFVTQLAPALAETPTLWQPVFQISLASGNAAAIRELTLPQLRAANENNVNWSLVESLAVSRNRWKIDASENAELAALVREKVGQARDLFVADDTAEPLRIQVAGLLTTEPRELSTDRSQLLERLSPRSSQRLQERIVDVLSRHSTPELFSQLVERWVGFTPQFRRHLVERWLTRPADTRLVLDAIAEKRLPANQFDAALRERFLNHPDADIRERAGTLLRDSNQPGRGEILASYASVLTQVGDTERGRQLYDKRCANCHQWEGKGHAVGPNLGESRNKPWQALLNAVLDPNQAVDQRYIAYAAATGDGLTHQGLLTDEADDAITLLAAEAKSVRIERSNLDDLVSSNRSLMPEGFERDLSPQDLADIFALVTQRDRAEDAPAAAEIAGQILDDARPGPEREALIAKAAAQSAELLEAMTRDLPAGNEAEEYRRIPWIWRVTIAAGKRDQKEELDRLLRVSLPQPGQPLRDWQAVVIGGGLINGITQAGAWPHERILEVIGNDRELKARWEHSIRESFVMSDNTNVRNGTRYDALRMVAMAGWSSADKTLSRYLAADVDAELQMGAVSGTGDVPDPLATEALIKAWPGLKANNRKLALEALLRSTSRRMALQEAVRTGQIPEADVPPAVREKLTESAP
ncbi:MAG: c-type cytochrome [Planctomycetaceae bacterium]|nr:c-type cytochrome [Planctomycetaceae bacterium]